MYKIIGADQKEYGPVTRDQVHQWIAEGRANGQTLVLAEGAGEWQPLSALPEFAAVLGMKSPASPPPPVSPQPDSQGREAAQQAVKGPAVALIATGCINIVMIIWDLMISFSHGSSLEHYPGLDMIRDPELQKMIQDMLHLAYGPVGIARNLLGLVLSVLILVSAVKMLRLRNYGLAVAASIIALVPCFTCCCIGLPVGIWALIVLIRPEVKSRFE